MATLLSAGHVAGLVSIGYSGRSVDELCRELQQLSVTTLVDVRLNAISRRAGFSKRALAMTLGDAGIEYQHEPLLGNPTDNREPFWSGDVATGRERFRQRLTSSSTAALERLSDMASRTCVAVLCVERDEGACHRQVIVEAVTDAVPELTLTRL